VSGSVSEVQAPLGRWARGPQLTALGSESGRASNRQGGIPGACSRRRLVRLWAAAAEAGRQADRLRAGRAYGRKAFDLFYVALAADLAESLRIARMITASSVVQT
jgi:hypothetical protein